MVDKGGNEEMERDEVVRQVKDSVLGAAGQLKALGPEHTRIAWLLEDALCYLDEIGMSEVVLPISEKSEVSEVVEQLDKTANLESN